VHAQPLVPGLVLGFEAVICWSPGPTEHGDNVLQGAPLRVCSKPLVLSELVRVHILTRRLAASHKKHVVAHQGSRIAEEKDAKNEESKGNRKVADGFAKAHILTTAVHQQLNQRGRDDVEGKDGAGCDKDKEVPIVALADTVVEPDAVMVVRLDAVVAEAAMVSAWGTPNIACPTVLHRNLHGSGSRFG